ncbi:hypothetical protein [Parendozoicomonas haliclonae]|uniref:Uncharacterized protein n=1 Tax=Parendozoicomonas haliclonae TaxID=1960125 RepID=A0A1X7AHK0_9GAMM|nr:hypothetical protein [Parendozoicomonas haliclonae]SMA40723.1 hypothetical protein EHSB41UT_01232 [Parendozoicomonas haliclonae]
MPGKKPKKDDDSASDFDRKARFGVVVTLEERPDDMLAMVMDTVEKVEGSHPDEWLFQKHFTALEHPAEFMENLQLSRKELAEIGEALMIWLMSREGRLK